MENHVFYPSGVGVFFTYLKPYIPTEKELQSAYYELEIYVPRDELPKEIEAIAGKFIFPLYDERDVIKAFIASPTLGVSANDEEIVILMDKDFNPNYTFFGIKQAYQAIRETGIVYLTDSYLSTIVLFSCGYPNALTLRKPFLNGHQLTYIRENADIVSLAFDYQRISDLDYDKIVHVIEKEEMLIEEIIFPEEQSLLTTFFEQGREELIRMVERSESVQLEEVFINCCLIFQESYEDPGRAFYTMLRNIRETMFMCEAEFLEKDDAEIFRLVSKGCRKENFPPHLLEATERLYKDSEPLSDLESIVALLESHKLSGSVFKRKLIKVLESLFFVYIKSRISFEIGKLKSQLYRLGEDPRAMDIIRRLYKWERLNDYFRKYATEPN